MSYDTADSGLLGLTKDKLNDLAKVAITENPDEVARVIRRLLADFSISTGFGFNPVNLISNLVANDYGDHATVTRSAGITISENDAKRLAYKILRVVAGLGKRIKAIKARKTPLQALGIKPEGKVTAYGYIRNADAEGIDEVAKLLEKERLKGKIRQSEFGESLDDLYDTLSDAADAIIDKAAKNNIKKRIQEDKLIPGSLSTKDDLYTIVKKLQEKKLHKSASKSKRHELEVL